MQISEESKQKAIKMYKKGELTVVEISNLVGISTSKLYKIFRECRDKGILEPRQGTNEERQKFTEEQEKEIATEYYETRITKDGLMVKWNIHPMQLQRIRNKYKGIYGRKLLPSQYAKQERLQQSTSNTPPQQM